ncbi:MAG TPA: TetR/AcrR family transcriptional regulator [Spirochaetia bacterium]|nr:TetR/AcrR family transcriptional regulator [Spirochaetia bacterium]
MKSRDPIVDDATKEARILRAAMDIFVEKGWSGARTQEIADRAGINKALLHYYFRSKENIYDKIIEKVFTTFFTALDEALKDDKPFEEVIRQFIYTVVDTIDANPNIPRFIMHELSQGGKNAKGILTRVVGRSGVSLPQRMVMLISRELAAERIQPVNPPQLILTILGSCIYYFVTEPVVEAILSHVQPDTPYERRQFIAERKESIFNVIYYGLKKREGCFDE